MYMGRLRAALLRMAGVGLTYYAGAWVGVTQTITPEGIAILWPPNAVLLSAFLLFPYRHWGSVGLAALGAELVADLPCFAISAVPKDWIRRSAGRCRLSAGRDVGS